MKLHLGGRVSFASLAYSRLFAKPYRPVPTAAYGAMSSHIAWISHAYSATVEAVYGT